MRPLVSELLRRVCEGFKEGLRGFAKGLKGLKVWGSGFRV